MWMLVFNGFQRLHDKEHYGMVDLVKYEQFVEILNHHLFRSERKKLLLKLGQPP